MTATGRRNNNYSTKFSYFVGKVKVREIIKQGLPNFLEYSIKDLVKFILVLLITIALALFIFNQIIDFKYKKDFLMTPCELCKEINRGNQMLNFSNLNITILDPLPSSNSPTPLGSYPA